MSDRSSAPIGIFDSGLGGLTVTAAVAHALPSEHLIYLGDTARVPYGTRSPETVIRYAKTCAGHLARRGVKILVVACNTVSAVALEVLRLELDIPVLGVIGPGARAGVRASVSGRIGVLATSGTVASGAYERAVATADSRAEVFAQAAPLLVPLAEEGWLSGPVPELAIERYLGALSVAQVDTVVLGCTHYPLLRPAIQDVAGRLLGPSCRVVDSAEATAAELRALLHERELSRDPGLAGGLELLVTDAPSHFGDVAGRFLGRALGERDVHQIDL